MNARQKAKHYKKLYEQMKLPIHTLTYLHHYRIEGVIIDEISKSECLK